MGGVLAADVEGAPQSIVPEDIEPELPAVLRGERTEGGSDPYPTPAVEAPDVMIDVVRTMGACGR